MILAVPFQIQRVHCQGSLVKKVGVQSYPPIGKVEPEMCATQLYPFIECAGPINKDGKQKDPLPGASGQEKGSPAPLNLGQKHCIQVKVVGGRRQPMGHHL